MKNNKNYVILSLFTTLTLAAFTGCSTCNEKGSHDERSAGRIVDDKDINKAVTSNLENEPVYKLQDVHATTYAGVVQLNGSVYIEDQKRRASELAKAVPGVLSVENNLAMKAHPSRQMSETGGTQPRIYSQPYTPDGVTDPAK